MKNLGEQWIENGQMYKAVEGIHCSGCCHNEGDQGCYISGLGCPTDNGETDLVVRDLGPVNEDGLLLCPFCGEYPTVAPDEYGGWTVFCDGNSHSTRFGSFLTKQEVIDEANRRA